MIRYSKMDLEKMDNPMIKGCADWMWEYGINGWRPYYLNIMFQPYPGHRQAVLDQMKRAICVGFYARLCTEFAHHPTKPSQQKKLPMLWLFPDRPVWKQQERTSIREMQFNENGLHFNGPIMIPPVSRFKECPIEHILGNQRKYAVQGIDRIHIKGATWDLDSLADYAGKTIKWDKELRDHVIILPDTDKGRPTMTLTVEERTLRDFQSQHNLSDETADQILNIEKSKKASGE